MTHTHPISSTQDAVLPEAAERFRQMAPNAEYWSLRLFQEFRETLRVRQNIFQPWERQYDLGAMVTIAAGGGVGYAATSDLTSSGLRGAAQQALAWAQASASHSLIRSKQIPKLREIRSYTGPNKIPWQSQTLEDKLTLLYEAGRALHVHPDIVDWEAQLSHRTTHSLLVSSEGGQIEQHLYYLDPRLSAIANRGAQTQQRTFGNGNHARQGGLEALARLPMIDQARRVGEEALALVEAPKCPSGSLDLVLLPSQMILQIHESIGHPLELDRILGDERNFAGTSFVTLNMFGNYQYGSQWLNVTFDPTHSTEFASYGFDDEGTRAERAYLIRHGLLERPLGGALSQARAGLPGVACSRACSWNRPPIDRMANLNLEPGEHSLDDLIKRVEWGVLMDTNRSWSIDDSRNNFQFGCEYGRIIRNGELGGVVRNPNYRGISASFWRSLAAVGDTSTFEILGIPSCGKGEPNQLIHVGHASPACLFRGVETFSET